MIELPSAFDAPIDFSKSAGHRSPPQTEAIFALLSRRF
jgi:hypothetical protein